MFVHTRWSNFISQSLVLGLPTCNNLTITKYLSILLKIYLDLHILQKVNYVIQKFRSQKLYTHHVTYLIVGVLSKSDAKDKETVVLF